MPRSVKKGPFIDSLGSVGKYELVRIDSSPTGEIPFRYVGIVHLDSVEDCSTLAAYAGTTSVLHFAYARTGDSLLQKVEEMLADGLAHSRLDFGLHGGMFEAPRQVPEIPRVMELGVRIPEDVSVIGFDDIPIASFGYIQLSTVLQPKYEMGVAAVRILIGHIQARATALKPGTRSGRRGGASGGRDAAVEGGESGEPEASTAGSPGDAAGVSDARQVVILEPELIVRKSSRLAPVGG